MTSLTFETAVMAIAKVQVVHECSEIEAIGMMQSAAAHAGDEQSLAVLCDIKAELIAQMMDA